MQLKKLFLIVVKCFAEFTYELLNHLKVMNKQFKLDTKDWVLKGQLMFTNCVWDSCCWCISDVCNLQQWLCCALTAKQINTELWGLIAYCCQPPGDRHNVSLPLLDNTPCHPTIVSNIVQCMLTTAQQIKAPARRA